MQKHPMTKIGAEALHEELERRKRVDRPAIVEAVATARAHGDLKENAEYHAAREQHGFNEGRIQELEAKLANAQVIDIKKMQNTGRVIFGTTVTVLRLDNEEELTFQIVGEDEADIKQHKISYSAPLCKALMGKVVDDNAMVHTPDGDIEYEIVAVVY